MAIAVRSIGGNSASLVLSKIEFSAVKCLSSASRSSGVQFTVLKRDVKISKRSSLDAVVNCSSVAVSNTEPIVDTTTTAHAVELLACPICFQPLTRKGPAGLNQRAVSRSGFQCDRCRKGYSARDVYIDLTATSGSKIYSEAISSGTELFRSPFVSFVYERGWRQSFYSSGFPGPEEELKMAQEFFISAKGGVLVDVSCGSGLFTRRFARTGMYSSVVGLDFSENMLRQSFENIKDDPGLLHKLIALVRADVARLPFATATIDAVHAGAALHCWSSPAAGVSEISRILRPGGVFVATTFLLPVLLDLEILKPIAKGP